MKDSLAVGTERPTSLPLPRNVTMLGWVSFLNDASSEMVYPLLPIFLTQVLKASRLFVGTVEGLAETTASLLKLFSGWFSDRVGVRKGLVGAGYGLAAFSRPLIAAAQAPWHVLLLRSLDRVGKGIRTSPRDALIADSTPEALRGRAFGFQRAMDHAGAMVGPLLASGLLLLWPEQYRLVFALAAVPAIVSLWVLFSGVQEIPPMRGEKALLPRWTLAPFDLPFRLFLLVVLLFTLGNSSDAFLLLRARELGIASKSLPLLWVALHLVKSFTSTPGGRLSDRWGRRPVIVLGWAVYATVYLGFGFARAAWQGWALFLAYGLYFGLTEGTEKALVADWVPSELRGTAYGLYHLVIGMGMLPASVLFGWLYQVWGAKVAFGFGALLAALASAGLLALRMPKVRVGEGQG